MPDEQERELDRRLAKRDRVERYQKMLDHVAAAVKAMDAALTIANKSQPITRVEYDCVSDGFTAIWRAMQELRKYSPEGVRLHETAELVGSLDDYASSRIPGRLLDG